MINLKEYEYIDDCGNHKTSVICFYPDEMIGDLCIYKIANTNEWHIKGFYLNKWSNRVNYDRYSRSRKILMDGLKKRFKKSLENWEG